MKNRTDLNLGDVFCLLIIYHVPHSWPNLLNGYDFLFSMQTTNTLVALGLKCLMLLY